MPRKAWLRFAGLFGLLAVGLVVALVARPDAARGGTTTYAQVSANGGTVDIWQNNATGVLTFQIDGGTDSTRLDPSSYKVTEIGDGIVQTVMTYASSSDAWSAVDGEYSVTQSQVGTALASGTTTSAPASASIDASTQNVSTAPYSTATDYANNLPSLKAGTNLIIPALTSLDGYSLVAATKGEGYGPDLADNESAGTYTGSGDTGPIALMGYGSDGQGGDMIDVNIAAYSSTNPTAAGSINRNLFNDTSYPHYYSYPPCTGINCPNSVSSATSPSNSSASTGTVICPTGQTCSSTPTEYAQIDEFQIVFQYHSEWVVVDATNEPSSSEWSSIVQSIVTAPTQ
jgi:hypothetical protein